MALNDIPSPARTRRTRPQLRVTRNAGASENVAADIVGHEKPHITYGLYSGGASLETKREALAKLRYPPRAG